MRSCFTKAERPIAREMKQGSKSSGPGGPQAQMRETNCSVTLRKLSSSLRAFMNALKSYGYYFDTKMYSAISSLRVELLVRILLRTFNKLSADTL